MKTFIITLIILSSVTFSLWGDLHDHYKKGLIVLKDVESFGAGNDWEDYFYNPYCDVLIAPDGSIFVISSRKHCIYKFDKNGKFINKFGQKGQGPSDMIYPGDPSIMENKYIVVGEYASNRRINIWDLNGNFVKLVRTEKSNFNTTALKENKVAYFAISQHAEKKNGFKTIYRIILKDINKGLEKTITKISMLDRHSIKLGQYISIGIGNYIGEVFLVQTGDGNLAIGTSDQPEIRIYSPDGEITHSFRLKISPIKVTGEYIKKFKDGIIADRKMKIKKKTNEAGRTWDKEALKVFKGFDFSTIFARHFPYYNEILIDSEGNFLVFLFTDPFEEKSTIDFQVYSPKGEFICQTQLDTGKYDLEIDTRFKNIRFTKDGIIGYAMEKGDEEEIYRLFKSNY